ncbi:MAG: hypothetical protein ABIQ02_03500, partial [Saprospiraceae bacterium]
MLEKINILFGLNLTQDFSDRFKMKLSGNTNKQLTGYSDSGFVGFSEIKYLKTNVALIANYETFRNIRIGAGIGYNHLINFEIGKEYLDFWDPLGKRYNQNQIGYIANIEYLINPLIIELKYSDYFSHTRHLNQLVKESNLIEFQVSYRIKIFNKAKVHDLKMDCPKF